MYVHLMCFMQWDYCVYCYVHDYMSYDYVSVYCLRDYEFYVIQSSFGLHFLTKFVNTKLFIKLRIISVGTDVCLLSNKRNNYIST